MDELYFAVKAAAKRTSEMNLQHSWKLTLEMKFLRLQKKLLLSASSPPPGVPSSMYDHLTILVEELAAAHDPYRWCNDLAEHLDTMAASLEREDVSSESLGTWSIPDEL